MAPDMPRVICVLSTPTAIRLLPHPTSLVGHVIVLILLTSWELLRIPAAVSTCAIGFYSLDGSGSYPCEHCPAGTYAYNPVVLSDCLGCPVGTTCVKGSYSIYFCTDSGSGSGSGSGSTQCAPGTYSDTGEEPCTDCPADTYNPNAGETDCLSCPYGEISPAGSTNITDCQDACAVKTCVGNEFCTNCLTSSCDVGTPDFASCTCPCEWGGLNCDIREYIYRRNTVVCSHLCAYQVHGPSPAPPNAQSVLPDNIKMNVDRGAVSSVHQDIQAIRGVLPLMPVSLAVRGSVVAGEHLTFK
ncbi:hypothetical protein ScPMuIL_010258 [Solemya velum]